MSQEDEEKTTFITVRGTFCFIVMPFGLQNASATFQKLMDVVFHDQIGRNVEAYVTTYWSNSTKPKTIFPILGKCFQTLGRWDSTWKRRSGFWCVRQLLPKLSHNPREYQARIEKVEAVLHMTPPRTMKKAQQLNDHALRRFLPQSANKCNPFFQLLKSKGSKGRLDNRMRRGLEQPKGIASVAPHATTLLPERAPNIVRGKYQGCGQHSSCIGDQHGRAKADLLLFTSTTRNRAQLPTHREISPRYSHGSTNVAPFLSNP